MMQIFNNHLIYVGQLFTLPSLTYPDDNLIINADRD